MFDKPILRGVLWFTKSKDPPKEKKDAIKEKDKEKDKDKAQEDPPKEENLEPPPSPKFFDAPRIVQESPAKQPPRITKDSPTKHSLQVVTPQGPTPSVLTPIHSRPNSPLTSRKLAAVSCTWMLFASSAWICISPKLI